MSDALRRDSPAQSLLSTVAIGVGAAAAAFGVGADALGMGGAPGIGLRQWLLIAGGATAAAAGVAWSPRRRAAVARAWAATPATSFGECVRIGAWIGIAIGFAEVLHDVALVLTMGILLKQPEHLLWMAPLCYFALYSGLGAGLGLLATALPRLVRLPVLVFALLLTATWSQFLLHPRLDRAAALLLTVGIAVQLTRSVIARPAALRAWTRRTLPWLIGSLMVAGAAVPIYKSLREQRAIAALPPPPEATPNVLLVVLDTVRADHLAAFGHHRVTTPAIDDLAARAAVFQQTVSTSPWTLPAHATMFTGRYHYETSADWLRALDDTHPTLAEAFTGAGYITGAFVGNLVYCLRENGLGRGFVRYDDFLVRPATLALSTAIGRKLTSEITGPAIGVIGSNSAEEVTDHFLDWFEDVGDRPFFGFLNYMDAHALYLAPEPFDREFGAPDDLLYDWYERADWSEAEYAAFEDAYDCCIKYVDAQFQRVLAALDSRGVLDDTIIVVTADHGELFGEHGLNDHGNSLYWPLVRVPLLFSWPDRIPARQIDEFVSLRDLPATILDLADITPTRPLPGHSLARHWTGGPPPAEPSILLNELSKGINTPEREPRTHGDMRSILVDGFRLIRTGDDGERDELYDMRTDPGEQHNLIGTPEGDARARALRAILDQIPRKGSPTP